MNMKQVRNRKIKDESISVKLSEQLLSIWTVAVRVWGTSLEFVPRLNVLTGEAGAGKSILMGRALVCRDKRISEGSNSY